MLGQRATECMCRAAVHTLLFTLSPLRQTAAVLLKKAAVSVEVRTVWGCRQSRQAIAGCPRSPCRARTPDCPRTALASGSPGSGRRSQAGPQGVPAQQCRCSDGTGRQCEKSEPVGRPARLSTERAVVPGTLGNSMRSAGSLERVPARSCNTQSEEKKRFDQCRPCIAGLALQLFRSSSGRLVLKGLCPVWGLSWKRGGKQLVLPGGCKKA